VVRSLLTLPSTAASGTRSRIVRRLGVGARITTPRFVTDYVVTEYGMAQLRGKSDAARARALVRIAHPAWRDALERDGATTS
jgi:4-hydroxybutyrate CoA-transferase